MNTFNLSQIADRLVLDGEVIIKLEDEEQIKTLKHLLSQKKYALEKQLMNLGILSVHERSRLRYTWHAGKKLLIVKMSPIISFTVLDSVEAEAEVKAAETDSNSNSNLNLDLNLPIYKIPKP